MAVAWNMRSPATSSRRLFRAPTSCAFQFPVHRASQPGLPNRSVAPPPVLPPTARVHPRHEIFWRLDVRKGPAWAATAENPWRYLSWDIEPAPSAANPVVQWLFRTHLWTEFRPSHSGMRPGVRTARSQTGRIRPRLDVTGTAPRPTAAPLRSDTDTASTATSAAWMAPAVRPPSKVASGACSDPSPPRTSRQRISGRSRP